MKKFRIIALIMLLASFICLPAFATTETSTHAVSGYPIYGNGSAGNLKIARGVFNITVAPKDGDIFEMCRVPANSTIVGGTFYAFDIDAGTETLDMDVGWAANGSDAADPDGLLNAGVLTGDAVTGVKPETGTLMPFGGVLLDNGGKKTFTSETLVQVEVNAAANSFSAGTIGIIVEYLMSVD